MDRESLIQALSPNISTTINRMPSRWLEINSIQVNTWRRLISEGKPRQATRRFINTVDASESWDTFIDYACPSAIASKYRDYSDGYSSDY